MYKHGDKKKDTNNDLKMKKLEDEVCKLKNEIQTLKEVIKNKEMRIAKEVDVLEKCKDLLNIKVVEINDL